MSVVFLLEFIGHIVKAADVVRAVNLDVDIVSCDDDCTGVGNIFNLRSFHISIHIAACER